MDLIRAAITGLFCDYPPDLAAYNILNDKKDYFEPLVHLVKYRQRDFTPTQLSALNDVITKQWTKGAGDITSPFRLLGRFTGETLTTDSSGNPVVRFENLLRWRELTLKVGEDLLITSFLAERGIPVSNFLIWPDVLGHDSDMINKILDDGLADNHSHLNGACDAHALGWIYRMNNIGPYADYSGAGDGKPGEPLFRFFVDSPPDLWDFGRRLSMRQWACVAAAIREMMFEVFMKGQEADITEKRMCEIKNMLLRGKDNVAVTRELSARIGGYSRGECRLAERMQGMDWDYAIQNPGPGVQIPDTPFMLLHGERRLMYLFFRALFNKDRQSKVLAPYVFLYHAIKTRFRRELIQSNSLIGLENFRNYFGRKDNLFGKDKTAPEIRSLKLYYTLQSAIALSDNDKVELRMCSADLGAFANEPSGHSIIRQVGKKVDTDRITVVGCLVKSANDGKRTRRCKPHYNDEYDALMGCRNNRCNLLRLTGLDVAGAETAAGPEVFGRIFRKARSQGMAHLTFHAGEDFYDLIDGLRTIDEAVYYLKLGDGCRIGHGMALAIDAEKYYERRKMNSVIPKQVYLDNMVWFIFKCGKCGITIPQDMKNDLSNQIHEHFEEIWGDRNIDLDNYWLSMLMRSDDLGKCEKGLKALTDVDFHTPHDKLGGNIEAATLLSRRYLTDRKVISKGNESETVRVNPDMPRYITLLQKKMIAGIADKSIAIECCPTSNLLIGPLERYDELPLFRFFPPQPKKKDPDIKVTIGSDDRGIFATSIRNEYSLLACALLKAKGGRMDKNISFITKYIKRLADVSNRQTFHAD